MTVIPAAANTSCLHDFPPLAVMAYFTLTLLLSQGSSLLRPSLSPRPGLDGSARLPPGKPRGAGRRVLAGGSAPSLEATWIAPRATRGPWAWGGARVLGSDWP